MRVLAFGAGGMSWLLGTGDLWSLAKAYARNEAQFDASGFSLHTAAGADLRFAFSDVRKVTWDPSLRVRLCTVETNSMIYRLGARSSPSPGTVARLIAERSGHQLQIQGTATELQ
jgi:hypothetical protein